MIKRWSRENGYKQVLTISLPLIASMSSLTVMQFTDRLFLANYSVQAIAAALPAGIASFTFVAFFMGVANYTNAFVAQYTGAGQNERVGASLWQGIYFAVLATVFLASLFFIARPLFNLIGHSPDIRTLEITYFRILTLGAGLTVFSSALACFYTGRGLTWTVMIVWLSGAVINIPLDYALINGVGPFPKLGIVGAGLATITGSAATMLILVVLIFRPKNEAAFGVFSNRQFDRKLFRRLMKYGLPSGVQFFLEIFGFTFFIFMLGRLGDIELAASNMVLSIETMGFLPMIGFSIGVSVLVGQAVGRGKVELGVEATTSALHLCLTYLMLIALMYLFMPKILLSLFIDRAEHPELWPRIMDMGVILLRFCAVFCIFDTLNIIYSGAIKGAGDTRFTMWSIAFISTGVMILPVWVAIEYFGAGLYTAWAICTLYIMTLGTTFLLRYRQGSWKKMRVIEEVELPVNRGRGLPITPEA